MRTLLRTAALPAALAAGLLVACSPSSLVDVDPPSTFVDVTHVENAAGATGLYENAKLKFLRALNAGGVLLTNSWVGASAMITDELTAGRTDNALDQRNAGPPPSNPTGFNASANINMFVHAVRFNAQVAREALRKFHPTAPDAWMAHLYSMEGYAVIMLAEGFCNGTPLSKVDFYGKQMPSGALSTAELFAAAVALFDSALASSTDPDMTALAAVGKARAHLGRGEFADAGAAAATVNTQFVSLVRFGAGAFQNDLSTQVNGTIPRVQDAEGGTGLVWSTDPRTGIIQRPTFSGAMNWAAKYYVTASGTFDPAIANPTSPVRVADGLEARLIEAEVALAANDANWLTILNTLRSTCIGTAACAPVPGLNSTNLPANLTDPGTPAARLDLLMRERAMWLYLTGHRMGDMRRLVRQYQRDPATLWPGGTIVSPGFAPAYSAPPQNGTLYGPDFVFYPHQDERSANPLYDGCHDFNP